MIDEKPELPQRIPGASFADGVHIGQIGALDLAMAGKISLEPAAASAITAALTDPAFSAKLEAALTSTGEHLLEGLRTAGTPIFDEVAAALADPLTAPIPDGENPDAGVSQEER